jgi:hypothetical protein
MKTMLSLKFFTKHPRFILIFFGLLAACSPAALPLVDTPTANPPTEGANLPDVDAAEKSPVPKATVDLNLDKYVYIPMMPRDAIRPIYNPEFVEAIDSPLHPDELVMGVAINGETKAYPVTVLRFREMVNDELGDGPILVTW